MSENNEKTAVEKAAVVDKPDKPEKGDKKKKVKKKKAAYIIDALGVPAKKKEGGVWRVCGNCFMKENGRLCLRMPFCARTHAAERFPSRPVPCARIFSAIATGFCMRNRSGG